MYDELKEFGLSENEIEVYIALLKIGLSTANRIAEISGLKRTTTYDNLNLLLNKGIVSLVEKEGVRYYESANPEKIIHLIEEKKEKIEGILPELKRIKDSVSEKTGVTYFEGKKGVLTVLNDILDEKKELWFFGSRKRALVALKHYPENFIQKRAEKNILLKAVLAEEDKDDPVYSDKKIFRLSSLKFLKDLNNVATNVFIYSDRVAFMTSTENPVGVIIRDKQVVEQQKTIFNILWQKAKN